MGFDLNKNSERQKRIDALAKTLRQGGFATSDTQARRMAEDMIGVEDKVQKRYDEMNRAQMEKIPGYSETKSKQELSKPQKVEIIQKQNDQDGEQKFSPIQEKYYNDNIQKIRERAGQKNEIRLPLEYEIPNDKPLRDLVAEQEKEISKPIPEADAPFGLQDDTIGHEPGFEKNELPESGGIKKFSESEEEPDVEVADLEDSEPEKKPSKTEKPEELTSGSSYEGAEEVTMDDEAEEAEKIPFEPEKFSNHEREAVEEKILENENIMHQKDNQESPSSLDKSAARIDNSEWHEDNTEQNKEEERTGHEQEDKKKKEDAAENQVDISEIFDFGSK